MRLQWRSIQFSNAPFSGEAAHQKSVRYNMERNMRKLVSDWAEKNHIDLLWPEEFESRKAENRSEEFQTNICIDYGKFIKKIPFFLFSPSSIDQLIACVIFLKQQSIPYKVRGAAHSSGGQVLTDQGAVIELSGLSRILEDHPGEQRISVEGGIWWQQLAEFLHRQGRRPIVLTDNLRTSVAGTLSVGGFGDTTHLYGMQISTVTELTLVTPDGETYQLKPSDNLFRFVLGGRGQLGIIANATLKTFQRTSKLTARILKWYSVGHYVEDAIEIIEKRLYEFCRCRVRFDPDSPHRNTVVALVGNFQEVIPEDDVATKILKHAKFNKYEQVDIVEQRKHDPVGSWKLCSPSVEFVLPLPEGVKVWQEINRQIIKSGLSHYFPRGSSIMVLRRDPNLSLAPLPNSDFCMLVALRPALPLQMVHGYLTLLRSFEEQALNAGGKVYLMSIEPECANFLEMQFGSALQEFIQLKNKFDPERLLNPGLIP
jgi:FAD/FMN-containing dehydrogenase